MGGALEMTLCDCWAPLYIWIKWVWHGESEIKRIDMGPRRGFVDLMLSWEICTEYFNAQQFCWID
jgi:hypothetical protein